MNSLTLSEYYLERLSKTVPALKSLSYAGASFSDLADRPKVAIVGTRKPTPYGITTTKQLVHDLCKAGVVIVSGLAIGVDSIAHKAALEANGLTIAVLPSGLNAIYPASHAPLARDICKAGGMLISEYPEQHTPRKAEFHARNRIIAALSDIVIIPEAATRSGSLNTAGHALRMGVPIGAVPGNITSPMSAGTNHLLVKGAHTITSSQDVLDILGISRRREESPQLSLQLLSNKSDQEVLILQSIIDGISDSNGLQKSTGIAMHELLGLLTMLEIEKCIARSSNDTWYIQ